MIRAFALIALLAGGPAAADIRAAVESHILPRVAAFAAATGALVDRAETDCTRAALRPAFHAALDAWMGVSHLTFGPLETNGRTFAIAFWPDTRGMVPTTLARLVADKDPAVADPDGFAEVSVAGRGFFALEFLLFDAAHAGYGRGSYTCRLVRAIAADLSRMAAAIDADWRDGYAQTLLTAGEPGNTTFLSEREAAQALYTALSAGLEFTADKRLDRPLGSFERPRPRRAEARRSGRSRRNVVLSLETLRAFAQALSDDAAPRTEAAFGQALAAARDLDDPVFAGVATPAGRLRVEALQQRVDDAAQAAASEIGAALGVSAGFNSSDGD